jgi:hypothetical protein
MADDLTTPGLLVSMLAVQAEAPALTRDKTATVSSPKGSYQYRYSSLDTVMEKIGPLLTKHRLVYTAMPSHDGETPTLRYELMHADTGEIKAGEMLLLLTKDDPQGQGSAITYARRYALVAVLNLVADDDDDGAGAMPRSSGPAQTAAQSIVDLRQEAKGLSDQGIKTALVNAGFEPQEKPWGQLARIPVHKATRLREQLALAREAEVKV